jgi:hypothetical protein
MGTILLAPLAMVFVGSDMLPGSSSSSSYSSGGDFFWSARSAGGFLRVQALWAYSWVSR